MSVSIDLMFLKEICDLLKAGLLALNLSEPACGQKRDNQSKGWTQRAYHGQSCDDEVKCMFADVSWNGNVLLYAGALK